VDGFGRTSRIRERPVDIDEYGFVCISSVVWRTYIPVHHFSELVQGDRSIDRHEHEPLLIHGQSSISKVVSLAYLNHTGLDAAGMVWTGSNVGLASFGDSSSNS
jgi:hypothetical protein